jgi:hypothetical protein
MGAGLILATLTTNVAANVVAPANAVVNLAPRAITFTTGGIITGVRVSIIMLTCCSSDVYAAEPCEIPFLQSHNQPGYGNISCYVTCNLMSLLILLCFSAAHAALLGLCVTPRKLMSRNSSNDALTCLQSLLQNPLQRHK